MPAVLTANAQIMCIHGGQVMLSPAQAMVQVGGGLVLCVPDLMTAPIVGCPQIGPGIVPCTLIMLTEPVISASPKMIVGGRPAYVVQSIGTPGGLTNGNPPGMIICASPGQLSVMG
jgi:hypothetical protein